MNSVFGIPSKIAVLGGSSDIGRAIADALKAANPHAKVQPCGRREGETAFDAGNDTSAAEALMHAREAMGGLDAVIIAFGVLGREGERLDDPQASYNHAKINYAGAVAAGIAAANELTASGGGCIVYLSSIAGVRVRKGMSVYGSAKSGADAFYRAAGVKWGEKEITTLIVRPGFVRTKMTSELEEPFGACNPDEVAQACIEAISKPGGGVRIVYTSQILRIVAGLMRLAPGRVWNKLEK